MRQLWRDAARHGAGNRDVERVLTARAAELQATTEDEPPDEDDVLEGELVDY